MEAADGTKKQVASLKKSLLFMGAVNEITFCRIEHSRNTPGWSIFIYLQDHTYRCFHHPSSSMPRPLKHISETPQAIAIGNTRFRPITSKERKFVEKNKKYWTNQREWPIDYGKFDKHHWKETMEVIEETAIEYLWLNDNKSKQVLRCLVTPKFTRLTILNLNSNLLTNAQAICRIRAPCLQRLQLNDNQIADVRAFRKTCFRNLSWLSMIVNWSVLSELYAPHLERLSFQRKPFPFLDESVDWLLRMQSQQIKRVDALSFRRIPQQAVRSAIGQRYSGLAMEWSTV